MLQVKERPRGPIKIKNIRMAGDGERTPVASTCSLEPNNGSEKPPC